MKSDPDSKISIGQLREDGTAHAMVTNADGTTSTMRLKFKSPEEIEQERQYKATLEKIKARDPALVVRSIQQAQATAQATTPKSESHSEATKGRFRFERGLWRIYLLFAGIWLIGILGLLVISIVSTGKIHNDIYDSLRAAAIVLPAVLVVYFIIKAATKLVILPVALWIRRGFIEK